MSNELNFHLKGAQEVVLEFFDASNIIATDDNVIEARLNNGMMGLIKPSTWGLFEAIKRSLLSNTHDLVDMQRAHENYFLNISMKKLIFYVPSAKEVRCEALTPSRVPAILIFAIGAKVSS